MATMRSYSLIIASSTAAFARPTTIYHPIKLFATSTIPPTPSSRWLTLASCNIDPLIRIRRRWPRYCRSRMLQQHYHDHCCFLKVPSSTTSSFPLCARGRYTPPSMFYFTSSGYQNWSMPHKSAPLSLPSILQQPLTTPTTIQTRLFGCNPNSPHATPGDIFLSDDREDENCEPTATSTQSIIPINLVALRQTIHVVREIIGYPTYDISLTLVNDTYMQQLNSDSRGISSPTDVLSFSLRDTFVEPGILKEEKFANIDEYYDLGELFIDVDYVQRRCEEDRAMHVAAAAVKEIQEGGGERREAILEGEVVSEAIDDVSSAHAKETDVGEVDDAVTDTDEYEYGYMEVEVDDEYYCEDEYDDRGVAPAMQYIYDPEIRIHMLVVHGMLHLVGYDHETDDEYELMVVREDEVLAELKRRLGEDFGLKRCLPSPFCEKE